MAKRVYKVVASDGKVRLIETISKVAAIAHVVESSFTASLPTQRELIDLVKSGVEIEEGAVRKPRGRKAAAE